MNRRGFLSFLGKASAGAYIAYSFPEIIVPKNIDIFSPELIPAEAISTDLISQLNAVTLKEIYPQFIADNFFTESPFLAYIREGGTAIYKGRQMGKLTYNEFERKCNRKFNHLAVRVHENLVIDPANSILEQVEEFIDEADWRM